MKIKEVVDALECFAPLPLQASFDNAGLQVGLTEADVSGALLCLDVTEDIVHEAVDKGCNLIVSHHPLLFHGLKTIADDGDYVQRTAILAIRNGITIVSMHTNMDNAKGGVNFKMAEKMGLNDVRFIGDEAQAAGHGSAVIGSLPHPLGAKAFIAMLKQAFRADSVRCNHLLEGRDIATVALCGGAGAFMLGEAISAGADAFVTGEMHYHEFFGHVNDIQIAVIGHYESEQYTSEIFQKIIQQKCKGVKTIITSVNTNPIIYM